MVFLPLGVVTHPLCCTARFGFGTVRSHTRETHASNMVVMQCILVCFDASLRVVASPEPLPLTQLVQPLRDGSRIPAWFPSPTTYSGMDVTARTQTELVVLPETARARHSVARYWQALSDTDGCQEVLQFPDRFMFKQHDPTIQFVEALIPLVGVTVDTVPRGNPLQDTIDRQVLLHGSSSLATESHVERIGRWLASDWDVSPAFSFMRNLVVLTKWSMERPRRIATPPLRSVLCVSRGFRCVLSLTTACMWAAKCARHWAPGNMLPLFRFNPRCSSKDGATIDIRMMGSFLCVHSRSDPGFVSLLVTVHCLLCVRKPQDVRILH